MPSPIPSLIEPLGDSYLLISFLAPSDEERWLHAHSLCRLIEATRMPGLVSTYAAYDTLLIEFDLLRVDADAVRVIVETLLRAYSAEDEAWAESTAVYRLPVIYGGDVAQVAGGLGLTVAEFIELHTSEPIRIRCRGVGGSLMMSNPPRVPSIARLPSPIIRENRIGEVNAAGRQCSLGFATGRATTGWLNIGHSPADLRAVRESSTVLQAGDRVRMEPVSAEDAHRHRDGMRIVEGATR